LVKLFLTCELFYILFVITINILFGKKNENDFKSDLNNLLFFTKDIKNM